MPSQLPVDRILDLARAEFGIESVAVKPYAGEHDRNLRLTDPEGAHHLVKLSGATSPVAALDWQERLLVALEEAPLPFDVPRLAVARDGARRIRVPAPEPVHLRVLSWVEGRLLAEAGAHTTPLRRSIGATSALLTEALAGVEPAVAPPRHHWLVEDAAASLDSVLPGVPPGPERELVERVRDLHARRVGDLGALPQATVHQDLHDENLLVDAAGGRVVGVIDFNDACRTARVADLAIAAAYGMVRQPDPIGALVEIIEGYLEHAPLADEELALVHPIAAMRLALNWTTWRARAAQAGDAAYAVGRSRHTLPALRALDEAGLDRTADALLERFARRRSGG